VLEVQEKHGMRIQMNLTLVGIQTCHVLNINYVYNIKMFKYIKPIIRAMSLLLLTMMRLECCWQLKSQRLWDGAQQVGFPQLIVE